MTKSLAPYDHLVEEDYIDMDISSATFLYYTTSSPPHSREFEFQMSANPRDRESATSPADELFYKGKLLPPRLQMVPNRSWSKRLKSIGHSSLGLKLKASRAYLKSFFTKSSCSDHESCALPKPEECSNGHAKAGKRKPFGQIQRERYNNSGAAALMRSIHGGKPNEEDLGHRKSFSGMNSTTKSSSCSSSFSNASSNGYSLQPKILKRSSSVNSEVESSIQGAIAYCKKSQQLVCARKSASDVGYYSVCF